jgi:hypothetical protein
LPFVFTYGPRGHKEDGMAKLGLLISESGVTSVAFLAVSRTDRQAAQALYTRIAPDLEEFEHRIGQRLHPDAALGVKSPAPGSARDGDAV